MRGIARAFSENDDDDSARDNDNDEDDDGDHEWIGTRHVGFQFAWLCTVFLWVVEENRFVEKHEDGSILGVRFMQTKIWEE